MSTIRHRTRTGIEIGIAHITPPPRDQGTQADAIQAALLCKRASRSRILGSTIPLPRDKRDSDTRRARAAYDRAMSGRAIYLDNGFIARVLRAVRRIIHGGK